MSRAVTIDNRSSSTHKLITFGYQSMDPEQPCFQRILAGQVFEINTQLHEDVILTVETFSLNENERFTRWGPMLLHGHMSLVCQDNAEQPFIIQEVVQQVFKPSLMPSGDQG